MSSIHDAFPLEKKFYGTGLGYTGSYKKALELLNDGADPNELNFEGFNLLHVMGEYRRGRSDETLLEYFEYMPQVLEKALPLMKGKGINQKLMPTEEYVKLKTKTVEDGIYSGLYAGCTPLHFATGQFDSAGFPHTKSNSSITHHKLKITYGELDKKIKEYTELFLKKLLAWGADKNMKNDRGWDAFEYIGETRSKVSIQNKVKKLLDKYG
jgi:hypothetical protein